MIIIAHRGLMEGPNPTLENHPSQISKAIDAGFLVEVDVRYINGEWLLGHDDAQYRVDVNFLVSNKYHLFIHAKNIDALFQLSKLNGLHYFFHDQDDCTLTSFGVLWTFPGKQLTTRSIAVMPERVEGWENIQICYGICTDYPKEYKERYK